MDFRYQMNLVLGREEWTNHRVEAYSNSMKMGHITIAFIEPVMFDNRFGTIESYARTICGIELSSHHHHAEELYPRYQRFRKFHVETAHVAYVNVDDHYRRQGIAMALYLEGARWIGERHNLMLASGGPQQPEVGRLWGKLIADPTIKTVRLEDGRTALNYVP